MKTFKQFISEDSIRLPPDRRGKINQALIKAGLDGNGRFESIGSMLGILSGTLDLFGVQIEEVLSADRFRESTKHQTFHLEFSNPQDSFSPIPISNSLLVLQYHIDELSRGVKPVDAVAYCS